MRKRLYLLLLLIGGGFDSTAVAADATYTPGAGENHVGFRKTTLTYEGNDQSQRTRSVLLWYPTSYRGQVGYTAEGGAV